MKLFLVISILASTNVLASETLRLNLQCTPCEFTSMPTFETFASSCEMKLEARSGKVYSTSERGMVIGRTEAICESWRSFVRGYSTLRYETSAPLEESYTLRYREGNVACDDDGCTVPHTFDFEGWDGSIVSDKLRSVRSVRGALEDFDTYFIQRLDSAVFTSKLE